MPRTFTDLTVRAFKCWGRNEESRSSDMGGSLWTDGRNLYSYATCLVTPMIHENGNDRHDAFIFNETKYSATTSNKQHAIRLDYRHCELYSVSGIDRGRGSETAMREAFKRGTEGK